MPVYLLTKPVRCYSPWHAQPVVWELEAVFPTLEEALDAEERARNRKHAIHLRASTDFPGIDPVPYLTAVEAYRTFAATNPRAPIADLAPLINATCSRLWELQVALHPIINPISASHTHTDNHQYL